MFGAMAIIAAQQSIAMSYLAAAQRKRKVFPSPGSVTCSYCRNTQQQKDQCWSCGAALPQPPTIRFDTLYGVQAMVTLQAPTGERCSVRADRAWYYINQGALEVKY